MKKQTEKLINKCAMELQSIALAKLVFLNYKHTVIPKGKYFLHCFKLINKMELLKSKFNIEKKNISGIKHISISCKS
jgi:hypothetical protein